MMKKSWKNKSAVSPVIATILMVAITVVLAAVLYVMVMGFGGSNTSNLTGSFSKVEKSSTTTEKITFGVITPTATPDKVSIRVDVASSVAFTAAASNTYKWTLGGSGPTVSTYWITPAITGPVVAGAAGTPAIAFTDMGADGKISSGDFITITMTNSAVAGTLPAGTYTMTVSMLNVDSGSTLNSIQYTWAVA